MTDAQKKELEAEKNKNNPNYKEETEEKPLTKKERKAKARKDKEKNKEVVELDYSKCDFPLPYSSQKLVENWYDFNDSTVTPIQPGVL